MKDPYYNSFRNALDEDEEDAEVGVDRDGDESSSFVEEGTIADESMDSTLPSVVTPRYQTYPPPLNGARSLTGGFVSLDGESVDIPVTDISQQSDLTTLHSEQEIVFEREEQQSIASSSSSIHPPSVVNISNSLSALSATIYDNLMTFKILGKDNLAINNRPTLPCNASSSPLPPPVSILRNPLPPRGTATSVPPTTTVALAAARKPITPKTVVSLASSAWLDFPKLNTNNNTTTTPLKEMAFSKKTGATPSTTDQNSVDFTTLASQTDCLTCCCPYWVRRSPLWLKVFVIVSMLFFLSATCLIGVAVSLALRDGERASQSQANRDFGDPVTTTTTTTTTPLPPTTLPSVSTTAATPSATASTTATDPSNSTTFLPEKNETNSTSSNVTAPQGPSTLPTTPMPTFVPTAAPPTGAPFPLTFAPTETIDRSVLEFMVTAGTWDESIDPTVVLPRLPVRRRQSFVVHLGDWNDRASDCADERYEAVREVWSNSACPVYFVAGAAETTACPNPSTALVSWRDALVEYHRAFWQRPPWNFWDDNFGGFPDAWVFDTLRTAVCGLHLTAGANTNNQADTATLNWIDINFDFYRRDYRLMVLLANTRIDDPAHTEFFASLFERIRDDYRSMNFVWVQPSSPLPQSLLQGNETDLPEDPSYVEMFQGMTNFGVITVQRNVWPPMRIRIDQDSSISVEQNEWFDQHTGLSIGSTNALFDT
eukprot:scaffold8601_cov191-Amphora_coffeaeformis.AAC.12